MTDNLPATRDAGLAALAEIKTVDEFAPGDLLIPWLKLVQGTSAVRKRTNEAYVPGAEIGMIYDTLTREMRESVLVSIVKYDGQHYTEFKPNGGDLVKQWYKDSSRYDASEWKNPDVQVGKKVTPDGTEIQPSSLYYVLVLDEESGGARPMILSLGGTQQKKARRLNALAKEPLIKDGRAFLPPLFARVFKLSVKIESGGDAGNEWGSWVIEPHGLITDSVHGEAWLSMAVALRIEADAGRLQPASPAEHDEEAPSDSSDRDLDRPARGTGPRRGKVTDLNDDVPF